MEITCPKCGNRGEIRGTEEHFEVRGQFQGKAVRKCQKCGAGVTVGAFLRKAKLIPDDLWKKMQESWDRNFPGS